MEPEGLGRVVQFLAEFFYVYDGILACTLPVLLKADMGIFMGIF